MSSWNILSQIRSRVAEEAGGFHQPASLRIALCHPAPYSVAMSSLGFQTIYREVNLHPDACAERGFLPDDPEEHRSSRTPVLTYESETPISDFPVLAFSIAYELELTGILEMLDLSGIPLLREERSERDPLILAGGPLTQSNPIVLSPFVDAMVLGEADELIHEILDRVATTGRGEWLRQLSTLPGCYVPGISERLPKAVRANDERIPARSQIITKNTVLASMFLVEAERGCSRNCAYCVMQRSAGGGMRIASPEKVLSLIPPGAERIGLVGAAVTDHPGIKEIVSGILAGGRKIGVSSLRADRLDEELVRLLAEGGYRTLTTASDGASQRLRDRMNRNTAERHLLRVAEMVRGAGLHRLKLYEMVGLPEETMDDIDELIRFSLELSKIAPLSLSIAPFVAKRNTPLDGAPFEAIPSLEAKLARIRSGLNGRVDVRPSSPRWGWVEYMLSQCGASGGLAAMDAWKAGGGFSSWKRAFARRGVIPGLAALDGSGDRCSL